MVAPNPKASPEWKAAWLRAAKAIAADYCDPNNFDKCNDCKCMDQAWLALTAAGFRTNDVNG